MIREHPPRCPDGQAPSQRYAAATAGTPSQNAASPATSSSSTGSATLEELVRGHALDFTGRIGGTNPERRRQFSRHVDGHGSHGRRQFPSGPAYRAGGASRGQNPANPASVWPETAETQIPSTGIELSRDQAAKREVGELAGTDSGTPPAGELAKLLRVLAGLTAEERASLLALAKVTSGGSGRRPRRSRS